MRFRLRSLGLLTLSAFLAGSNPAPASEVKAVIELFTSQGCSSCPPADRLLGEYAKDERVIALSLSVDYWDYLGWRDTLALHAHSLRQKGYSDARHDRHVYTPQVVVNGLIQGIGNKRHAVERAIAEAERNVKLSIPVSIKRNDTNLEIEVGAATGAAASIWILPVKKQAQVKIKRGENQGKTVIYHNVVRGWTRIGEWNGKPVRASVSIPELAQAGGDYAVVLVQPGTVEEPGPIRGAALIELY